MKAKPYIETSGPVLESALLSTYIFCMPNRKTFDEREKVDHSGHPLGQRQPSDLKADIQDEDDQVVNVTPANTDNSSAGKKPGRRANLVTPKAG
jgi:hypothetical protein